MREGGEWVAFEPGREKISLAYMYARRYGCGCERVLFECVRKSVCVWFRRTASKAILLVSVSPESFTPLHVVVCDEDRGLLRDISYGSK